MIKPFVRRVLDAIAVRIAARLGSQAPRSVTERLLNIAAKQAARAAHALPPGTALLDTEFRVYSQFGEDGIVQHLIRHARIGRRTFVEFGVQDYLESNTRFLLLNDNWSGLVIDSSPEYAARIRADGNYWRHDLTVLCAFITRDNINDLISTRFCGQLGLLSIDIDGNDYWIWDAITCVEPDIVICEYNSVFGARLPVTVPYRPDFDRAKAHYSYLYFGASLPALCRIAARKGYEFVGSNSAGVNAFFVRKDRLGALRPLGPAEGYVESKFRESRGKDGRMTHLAGVERLREIRNLPLLELDSGTVRPIAELFESELSRGVPTGR